MSVIKNETMIILQFYSLLDKFINKQPGRWTQECLLVIVRAAWNLALLFSARYLQPVRDSAFCKPCAAETCHSKDEEKGSNAQAGSWDVQGRV